VTQRVHTFLWPFCINKVTCTSSVFDDTLSTLTTDFADTWSSVVSKVPKATGISFGSCYTSCGSVGITDTSVYSITLNDNLSQVTFSACKLTDLAVLIVPVEISLSCTLALRATGVGYTWPTPGPGDDGVVYQNILNITGNILVSVPRHSDKFDFPHLTVDVMFTGNWTLEWPDNENILFNTVPVNELATKYVENFNAAIRGPLSKGLRLSLQSNVVTNNCTFPTLVPNVCTANTRTATEFCDPCDTCCMCLMQQRCDGECSQCACVQCDNTWYATLFLSVLLFFGASFVIAITIANNIS